MRQHEKGWRIVRLKNKIQAAKHFLKAFKRPLPSGDTAVALPDRIGQIIRQNPTLRVEISAGKDENESGKIVEERTKSITDYLASKWQIASDRIITATTIDSKRGATLRIKLNEKMPVSTNTNN